MKALVTGADGFVGTWLVSALESAGHEVVSAVLRADKAASPHVVEWDLQDSDSVRHLMDWGPFDAVFHLAGVSSGGEARRDVAAAWASNALGTVRLAHALVDAGQTGARFLYVSTAEVYGATDSRVPTDEGAPVQPCSPYAASKLGGEIAALEFHRRLGLPVVVARSFPHSGRGQDKRFVIPAFAHRVVTAKAVNAPAVKVGNLQPVRDILHVSDVVEAYIRLIEKGVAGEVYNVASGNGYALSDMLDRMCDIVEYRVVTEVDASLVRTADIPYLVGDATKLRARTGWAPQVSVEAMLTEVLDAQAN